MDDVPTQRSSPPLPDVDAMGVEDVDELEALEAAARERWGEAWTIDQRHWADGTTSTHAFHLEPTEDPDVVVRDRLFVGADGDVYHDRKRVRREETLDVLERDEPPEGATSEFIVENAPEI